MVNISIDVTDLGGEARPGDKVVLWKPAAAGSATHAGRVISTAPVDVFLTNGKASVPDVEPGSMRVLLQCRGIESQGPIDVTVPDGTGTVTLRSLVEAQFEYAPPIVSAVQEAASNASASEEAAIQAQIRSEAAADRAEDRVDEAINNGAELVRDEVKQDADRAVSASQAATQSESNAATSEGAAASSASNAATSETNAKQSETNAGDFAAVATTAATEAVDAMERATAIVGGDFATREDLKEVESYLEKYQPGINDRGDWSDEGVYGPGDIVTHDDARWLGVQSVEDLPERKNLIPNPRFVSNRSGWTAGSGVTVTVEGETAVLDFDADKALGVSAFQPPRLEDISSPAASGSFTIYNPGDVQVPVRLQLWRDGSSTQNVDLTIDPGATVVAKMENVDISMTSGIRFYISGGRGSIPSGTRLIVSKPILELAETVGEYFDGSFDDIEDSTGSITYGWEGEENNSTSTVTGSVITPPAGEPGESETWVLTGRISMPEEPVKLRLSPPENIPDPEHVVYYISDLSPDGLTLLGVTGWHIRVSTDDAKSWKVVSNFSELGMPLPRTVRWLPDGEIIVNTNGVDGSGQHVYRSKGADWGRGEPTWEHVFTLLSVNEGPAHGWSWSIYENIVLLAGYGSKTGVDNARHVYLSTDMGRSFRMVHELPNERGIHQHGVAWDPYWDRIWLTFGDDKDGWKFSDDLGETWHFAKYDDYASAGLQAVGIFPTKDAILFASDGSPNGLWRIPRSQGKHTGFYEPEVAFQFNDQSRITHLCHAIYQRSPDHPVLFGYGAETQAMPSRVIATHDGYEVCDVWEDTFISEAGRGLRSLVGPTARGNLIWEKQDAEHGGSGRFRYTVPWPGGYDA